MHIGLELALFALPAVAEYATHYGMSIDTQFFTRALEAKRLSGRALAKLMGIDPSAVSLMLRGKRQIRMAEAAQIAQLLGLSLSDVVRHAGIQAAGDGRVSLIGWIDGNGEVHMEDVGDSIEAPPTLPPNCVAVQFRTALTGLDHMDRWLVIYQQPDGKISPDALDRYCVVRLEDGPIVIGHLKRGYKRGLFNMFGPVNLQDIRVEWATPVVWIKP